MAMYLSYKKFGCKDKKKKTQLLMLKQQYQKGEEAVLISRHVCRVRLSSNGELLCYEGCPFLNQKRLDKFLTKKIKQQDKELAKSLSPEEIELMKQDKEKVLKRLKKELDLQIPNEKEGEKNV